MGGVRFPVRVLTARSRVAGRERTYLVAAVAAESARAPRLAEVCRKILLTRIAWGRGRASALDDDGAVAEFPSPVRALGAALRIQYDLASLNRDIPAEKRCLYRIGVGIGEAAELCARARPGGICADDGVIAAAARRLDVECEELGPLHRGSATHAYAVVGTLTGRVFRYKPWTTPGRRRAGLVLVATLIVALAALLGAGADGR